MNMKMKLKKSFFNIYSKIKHNEVNNVKTKTVELNESKEGYSENELIHTSKLQAKHYSTESYYEKFLASSSYVTKDSCSSSSKETSFNNDYHIRGVSVSSSGYGTSSESPVLSFMNIENFLYEEQNSQDRLYASDFKSHIFDTLLQIQADYMNELEYGLTRYVRPLSSLIDSELFIQTFQNVEKIYRMTVLIYNSLIKTYQVSKDIFYTIETVFEDLASVIFDTYDVYFSGYNLALNGCDNQKLLEILSDKQFQSFNFEEFITIPIMHIFKIYNVFTEIYQNSYSKNNSLTATCNMLRIFVKRIENQSLFLKDENIAYKDLTYNFKAIQSNHCEKIKQKDNFPHDYIDEAGNKFYFL